MTTYSRMNELQVALGRIEVFSEPEWNSLDVPAQARLIAELENQLRAKNLERRRRAKLEAQAVAATSEPQWGSW